VVVVILGVLFIGGSAVAARLIESDKFSGWTPTTFVHPQEGPHVPSGDAPLQCDSCHQGGFGQKPGCPCHGGNPPTGD